MTGIPQDRINVRTRTEKICPHFRTTKAVADFHRNAARPDGRESHCIACIKTKRRGSGFASSKRYYEKNKDRLREYHRAYTRARYRRVGPEVAKRSVKAWYAQNRATILARMGGVCVKCGFADTRALQIDHVAGGGNRERKAVARDSFYVRLLKHGTNGYQLLCANCNWIKRLENNEHTTHSRGGRRTPSTPEER